MKDRDFTLEIYKQLISELKKAGYSFQRVEDFIQKPVDRVVVLRHDVDLRNWAATRLAKYEASIGIKSTYYFRIGQQSYSPKIIKQIVDLGHEIGYHYEDLASCNGDFEKAIRSFEMNLDKIRQFYPVKTVCMHGSSGTPYDNRDLWKHYKLEDFGLICEPYISIDYDKVLYFTDTGRCWDGFKMSVRDKVESSYKLRFHRTEQIISSINILPNALLFTIHPEQWTNNIFEWLYVKLFVYVHTMYKVHYRNKRYSVMQQS